MRISSFNINKFCGPYGQPWGGYRNPKNIDFKSRIKEIVDSLLVDEDDIVFLQEFIDNRYINVSQLFEKSKYQIFINPCNKKCQSYVVAVVLKESKWEKVDCEAGIEYPNRFVKVKHTDKDLRILGLHNTDNDIKKMINKSFELKEADIVLGDFNDEAWIRELSRNSDYNGLVTDEMITYKPGQTAVDQIFVKRTIDSDLINFDSVIETFASDHNIISFELGPSEKVSKYSRSRKSNIPFSLHDSRIQKIEESGDTIIVRVDNLFQYMDDHEMILHGAIEFTKADIEECSIMIFNSPFGFEGVNTFSGEKLSFDEYKGKYPEAEFEIVTETYNGYDTVYQGWIWSGDLDPMFGIMTIWNSGDMIYKIKKESDL